MKRVANLFSRNLCFNEKLLLRGSKQTKVRGILYFDEGIFEGVKKGRIVLDPTLTLHSMWQQGSLNILLHDD